MKISFTSAAMEVLLWTYEYLFSKRSNHIGLHRAENVTIVSIDWHPTPTEVKHKGLWWARMHHRPFADFLHVPPEVLIILSELATEVSKIKHLSNYAWAEVPTGDWPLVWRDTELT